MWGFTTSQTPPYNPVPRPSPPWMGVFSGPPHSAALASLHLRDFPRPFILFFFFFFFFLRCYFLRKIGREGGRRVERSIRVREIHWLVASRTPSDQATPSFCNSFR